MTANSRGGMSKTRVKVQGMAGPHRSWGHTYAHLTKVFIYKEITKTKVQKVVLSARREGRGWGGEYRFLGVTANILLLGFIGRFRVVCYRGNKEQSQA